VSDPSFLVRSGDAGAILRGTPGHVLAFQSDGQTLKGVAPSAGTQGELCLTASGAWASLTNGAAALAQLESPLNKVNYFVAEFLQAVQSFLEWDFAMPADWDGEAVDATFHWASLAAATDSVVWGLQGRSYADGASIDQAFGAAVEVTDANHGAGFLNVSPVASAVTFAGAPAGGQHVQVRAYRLGSGADNLAATANLLEVRVTYGRV